MPGITFGSVGDIIAVGQLARALAQALSEARGSAKQYQGLVKELQGFEKALLQVVALWQNYQDSPELDELGAITKDTVQDWRDILLGFREKIGKKYGSCLSSNGSGNWAKDTSKKITWLKEKEDIRELRGQLQIASSSITVLVLAAIGTSNKLNHAAQKVRVEFVSEYLQECMKQAEEQMSELKRMGEKLDSQAETTDTILTVLRGGVGYLPRIYSIAIDMRNWLSQLNDQISSLQITPRSLETHWKQAPVTLEDALGFLVPIPLELVDSWEMFDMIIAKRFEHHAGHQKIQRREYTIEEDITGRGIRRTCNWSMSLRPGQKVSMSVVFSDVDTKSNHCPRCQTKCTASLAERTQCVNKSCRMWFQRVSEDADVNVSTADTDDRSTRTTRNFTKKATGPAIHPRDFQRVKLMMKLTNTGANVNLADDRGETALLAAIQSADSKILEIIAEAGADVNLADGRGTTPLYEAAWSDHSEVVKLLYQQKKSRETALHGPRRSPQGPR